MQPTLIALLLFAIPGSALAQPTDPEPPAQPVAQGGHRTPTAAPETAPDTADETGTTDAAQGGGGSVDPAWPAATVPATTTDTTADIPDVGSSAVPAVAGPSSPAHSPNTTDVVATPQPPEHTPSPAVRAARNFFDEARVTGYAQIDYLRRQISLDQLSDGNAEPLNEDKFEVRRARLHVERDWHYVGISSLTEIFADGDTVRPVAFDIHGQLPANDPMAPPLLRFSAGLMAVPFGFENFVETNDVRFFGERSLLDYGLVPGLYDLGVSISGHIWSIDWIVAAQNGEPLESGAFSYDDPNAAKDYAGRVRVSGQLARGVRAAAAVSMLYGRGFSPGTPPTKDTFEWRDLNEDGRVLPSELIPIPGSAARPSTNFDRWGLGGDVQIWTDIPMLGQLMIYGEVAVAVNLDRAVAPADPVLLGRDQRSVGAYLAATQQLTEHATIGVRLEQYEPNVDSLELFDGVTVVTRRRFRVLTAGVAANLHMSSTARARLLAEYVYEQNSLGRDNRGRPAQLDNDTLRLRVELVF